ncbi:MAG: ATP-binding protein [Chloroflexota bacterium]|nr:ATP-binding protein [Chloroflexota bacterium]
MNNTLDSELFARTRAELQLHDRAMSASSCGITIADATAPQLPLIYVNDAFARITGYSLDDSIGRNCRFLQRDDRDQPELLRLRACLQSGDDCTVLLRNYRKDGSLFWNELYTSPVHDSDGRLTHFVGVQTDVTARVEAEAALRRERDTLEKTLAQLRHTQAMLVHSEKMSALGQLVAGVAHEINNPIAFVNSNLHSLQRTLDDVFDAYARLETITTARAGEGDARAIRVDADLDFVQSDVGDLMRASLGGLSRVKKIVDGLRTFARLDEAERKLADVRDNIDSTLILASVELRNRVRVMLELDGMPHLMCYPAELNQAFLNLIINAAQAIPESGTLTIGGWDEGDHVVMTFTDTGVGIPPEILPRIFEPFFTTKPIGKGTGLGLAIAYQIVTERHHGTLTVDSTPDVGTTFTITLPKSLQGLHD